MLRLWKYFLQVKSVPLDRAPTDLSVPTQQRVCSIWLDRHQQIWDNLFCQITWFINVMVLCKMWKKKKRKKQNKTKTINFFTCQQIEMGWKLCIKMDFLLAQLNTKSNPSYPRAQCRLTLSLPLWVADLPITFWWSTLSSNSFWISHHSQELGSALTFGHPEPSVDVWHMACFDSRTPRSGVCSQCSFTVFLDC